MTTSDDLSAYADLKRVRRRATALLAAITGLFIATFFMPDTRLVGWVRAFAEAGMIGGVADWFAVVALFRHPLGIPIPHTAIIPSSKGELGRNLARFIVDNFLDPEHIVERLGASRPAHAFGKWVSDPDNARSVSGQVAAVTAGLAEGLASDAINADLERILNPQLGKLPYGHIAGGVLEATIRDGHHHPLIDAGLRGAADAMIENRSVLRERLGEESPWWVPEQIDDAVFDRAFGSVITYLLEVAADPAHPLRDTLETQLGGLTKRLLEDERLGEKIGERVQELLRSDEMRAWIQTQWSAVAGAVSDAAERPDSELRESIAMALVGFGQRIGTDDALADRIERWIISLAGPVADAARRELGTLIEATVDRWDAEDTSRRLELWMGRDLQFVRVNGTLVGGLVGILIHSFVVVFGG